jgi:hypothetical protein
MKEQNKQKTRFAICIVDSEPDLTVRKLYRVLPDPSAAKDKYIRVVDESGEDYLYPSGYFVFIEVSQPAEEALLTVVNNYTK